MSTTLNDLTCALPCRSKQLEQLHNLFCRPEEPFPDAVYVHGGPGVGKSTLVTSLLRHLRIKRAVMNLIECYAAKTLFESILNELSGHKIDPSDGQPFAKCDNFMDFLQLLPRCLDSTPDDDRKNTLLDRDPLPNRAVIVLDKAEELRNMDANLLPGFLRLREITGLPVTVILISELPFTKYYGRPNVVEPIKIYFPQYNKEELLQVMMMDAYDACATIRDRCETNVEFDEKFYKTYLNLFLSVFYRACRDVCELRHMARVNFARYCEPVVKGECDVGDSMTLWRHVSPILKDSLEVLYLRVRSGQVGGGRGAGYSKQALAQSLELPYYAKYLLIAAYLASYNPAKEDKKLFMKFHGKKKKTKGDMKMKSKVSELLHTQLGPQPFTFDRLLAIFYAILDEKVGFNNNLLVQVSSLVELQLLCSLSDATSLDGQKYKCNVDLDFIQLFARMVGFNIRKYLVDFN